MQNSVQGVPERVFARLLVLAGGIILLLLSLYVLHYWLLMGLVEAGLAPWDYGLEAPPTSGWQSTVNSFFTHRPGELLPSIIVLIAMAVMFVIRCNRDRDIVLPLEFGLLNLGFVVAGGLSLTLVMGFYRPLINWLVPGQLQGFHVTWPIIVVSVLVLLGLAYFQATGWLFTRIRHRQSLQVAAMLMANAATWLVCGPGITFRLFRK